VNLVHIKDEVDYVKDYYDFVVKNLQNLNSDKSFSLLGLRGYDTLGKDLIFINYEHNLVHPHMNYNLPFIGKTPVVDSPNLIYQIRIENPQMFFHSKFYIDYSLPNIKNIETCEQLKPFIDKIIYIPPLLCEYNTDSESRDHYDIITSFYILDNQGRPRRKNLFDKLTNTFNKYFNLPKIFGEELYETYYKKSKVLINLHQTDFHHTVEELRILPALLNGLIVISEDSPLKETIPYHEYVIWTTYDKLVETANEVLENYNFYYEKIHGKNSKLKKIITQMEEVLEKELKSKFETPLLTLSEIFNKYGSDKGTYFTHVGQTQNIAHHYTWVYEQQFEKLRNEEFNLLEIGIWSPYYPGASVRAWTEYFTKVNFYGIDIMEDCKQLSKDKVNIDIVDQTSEQALSEYIKDKPLFKVIIDDGCHEERAILISLGTLFPHLESGGFYYIEDLHVVDKSRLYNLFWKRMQTDCISQDKVDYIQSNMDWCSFSPDGKLLIIKKK